MRKIKTVICLCLSALLMIGSVCEASAYTVDDLREFAGKGRVTDKAVKSEVSSMIKYIESSRRYKEMLAEIEQLADTDQIEDIKEKEKALRKTFKKETAKIHKISSKNRSAKDVLYQYRIAVAAKDELDACIADGEAIQDGGKEVKLSPKTFKKRLAYVKEIIKGKNDKTDIGEIGESLEPVTENVFSLYMPYGKVYSNDLCDGSAEVLNMKGIWINAGGEKWTNIRSQWAGKVLSVKKEKTKYEKGIGKTGGYTVKIKAGKTVYLTYRNLDKVSVKKGSRLKQYSTIGKIKHGGKAELRVVLDSERINPLLLYGDKGVDAYEEWASSHPAQIVKKLNLKKQVIKDIDTSIRGKDYVYGYDNPLPSTGKAGGSVMQQLNEEGEPIGEKTKIQMPAGYIPPKDAIIHESIIQQEGSTVEQVTDGKSEAEDSSLDASGVDLGNGKEAVSEKGKLPVKNKTGIRK